MKKEIGLDGSVMFFVSTDDPQVEWHLRQIFADKIITHEKRSYDRRRAEAIEDALVDLYCLSRTVKIYGSQASTFSTVAAELSDIPIELVDIAKNPRMVSV